MIKFTELGLSKELLKAIFDAGFQEPSEIQEKTIPLALAGRDIIGGSATGSGKTLVFAVPIIEKLKPSQRVQALILTPTRELAEQVSDSIKKFSVHKRLKTCAIYGGVDIGRQIRILANVDVVVGTPGRILDHLNRRTLRLDAVKFLVLDEVDRMFDMGFQKDVEKILNHCPRERQTILFSATISATIDHLAKKYTKNAAEVSVESYIDASKLKQIYYDVDDGMKFSLLVYLLKKEKKGLVMIFCGTRRNVDFIARNLTDLGIEAKAIHGGMAQNKRINVLKEFHGKSTVILVCTDVAARGLDIKEVSHIYNYDLPKTSEEYIHRIGRTARAGKEGEAISLLGSRDRDNFSNILRDENLIITRKETPEIGRVHVKIHDRGGYDNFRREGGRAFHGGSSRGGHRRERSSSGGSGRSFHGGRSYGGRPHGGYYSRGKSEGRRDYNSQDGDSRRDRFSRGRRSGGGSRRNIRAHKRGFSSGRNRSWGR